MVNIFKCVIFGLVVSLYFVLTPMSSGLLTLLYDLDSVDRKWYVDGGCTMSLCLEIYTCEILFFWELWSRPKMTGMSHTARELMCLLPGSPIS